MSSHLPRQRAVVQRGVGEGSAARHPLHRDGRKKDGVSQIPSDTYQS